MFTLRHTDYIVIASANLKVLNKLNSGKVEDFISLNESARGNPENVAPAAGLPRIGTAVPLYKFF
jgi:hypothetical protein